MTGLCACTVFTSPGDKSCLNGGICYYGMCHCSQGFYGQYCEFSEFNLISPIYERIRMNICTGQVMVAYDTL